MIIEKILNNNAIIINKNNQEMVVMGKGIAFKKKVGESIEESSINKTYYLSDPDLNSKLISILSSVDYEVIEITEKIIEEIKLEMDSKVSESIYINLIDHIQSTLDRYKDGIRLPNPLIMDIKKFYPSITHDILYEMLQRKIKDKKLLKLLKERIYSAKGVPIGNYLSQFFANLYLTYFDHWVKEELKCKYYFRYADDIVILGNDKNYLRNVLVSIKLYLKQVLNLELKPNYQIFPVESRGIDFVGYKFYHTHVLLRKSIKMRMFRLINLYKQNKIDKDELNRRMRSYFGWMKFCNSKNLLRKVEELTGLKFSNWNGKEVNISKFYNKYIHIVEVVDYDNHFRVHFMYNNKPYYFKSKNRRLHYSLLRYKFPINFKITPYVRAEQNTNGRLSLDNPKTWERYLLL